MIKLVTIASPYRGAVHENISYARRALHDSIFRGELPVASHLLYTQVLNDTKPFERDLGVGLGLDLLRKSEALIVYTDNGISPGMWDEINLAIDLGITVEYRSLDT